MAAEERPKSQHPRGRLQPALELLALIILLGFIASIILHQLLPAPDHYEMQETRALNTWSVLNEHIDSRFDKRVLPCLKEIITAVVTRDVEESITYTGNQLSLLLDDTSLDIRTRITLAYWLYPMLFESGQINRSLINAERMKALTLEAQETEGVESRWLYTLAVIWFDWANKSIMGEAGTVANNVRAARELLQLAYKRELENGWYELTEAEIISRSLPHPSCWDSLEPDEETALAKKAIELVSSAARREEMRLPLPPPFTTKQEVENEIQLLQRNRFAAWQIAFNLESTLAKLTEAKDMEARYDLTLTAAEMLDANETGHPCESQPSERAAFAGNELLQKQISQFLGLREPPLPDHSLDAKPQFPSGEMNTDAQPWWQDEVEELFRTVKNTEDTVVDVHLAQEIFDALTSPPVICAREAGDKFQVYWRDITCGRLRYKLYNEYLALLAEYLVLVKNQKPDWATPRFWEIHEKLEKEVALIQEEVAQRKSTRHDWFKEWAENVRQERTRDIARAEKQKPELISESKRVAKWLKGEQGKALEKLAIQIANPNVVWMYNAGKVLEVLRWDPESDIPDEEYKRKTKRLFELASGIYEVHNRYRDIELCSSKSESPRERALRHDEIARLRPLLAQLFFEAYETVRQERRDQAKNR